MPSLVSSDRVISFKDLEVLVIKLLDKRNVLKPVPPIETKKVRGRTFASWPLSAVAASDRWRRRSSTSTSTVAGSEGRGRRRRPFPRRCSRRSGVDAGCAAGRRDADRDDGATKTLRRR